MQWKTGFGFVCLFFGLLWFFSVESSDKIKVWIFFKDRPYVKLNSSSVNLTHFSHQATERRLTRGLEKWSESDLPVEANYVEKVKAAGAKILVTSRWLNAVSANCDSQCRSNLEKLSFISTIQPVATFRRPKDKTSEESHFSSASANSTNGLDYGESKDQLEQMNIIEAHKKGYAGQGEIVALFSTGFMKNHYAFRGHEIVAEHDFVHGDSDCSSGNPVWLGTASWSVIGGEYHGQLYGPAYRAKVILAATDQLGSQTTVEEDHWVAAFEMADQNGASVVNGTLGSADWYKPSDYDGKTAISSRVASMAAQKGILVTSCAGVSTSLWLPGDAFDILTVGMADANGVVQPYSSRGPTADGRLKPELIGRGGRGVKVYKASTLGIDAFTYENSGYESCSFIAGAAAVVFSARPNWNPLQVREALMKTASRADRPSNGYGYGIVNVAKAIDFLPAESVVIDHNPIKNRPNTGQPFKVIAKIRAQRGLNLNQLNLFWKKKGAATFQRVSLTPVPAVQDSFQGFIPAQTKGTTVHYYLAARDIKGKTTKAPFGPGKVFEFTIL